MTNIGIITQARMTSTRLPGKIFLKANEKTLLQHHIDRLQKTGFEIVIATTINSTDDCVSEFAAQNNIKCHRGSEDNVLSRYYEAATKFNFETIVRVTSDCPLIDPHLIRNSMEKYLRFNNPNLYMSNGIERTFARGFDFEIFSYQSLKDAYFNASEQMDVELVTPYIWKNRSGKTEFFYVKQIDDHSTLRITVDTEADYDLIKALIEKYNASQLSYNEIENILSEHHELVAMNAHIEQKKV
jgi:spore coat polysaccharide biosynthesis protein SpsF